MINERKCFCSFSSFRSEILLQIKRGSCLNLTVPKRTLRHPPPCLQWLKSRLPSLRFDWPTSLLKFTDMIRRIRKKTGIVWIYLF